MPLVHKPIYQPLWRRTIVKTYRPFRPILCFVILVGVAAALLAGGSRSTIHNSVTSSKFDKRYGDRDLFNSKARTVFGNYGEPAGENEATDSDLSPASGAEEEYGHRAYPLSAIPASFTANAQQAWKAYAENKDGSNGGNNPNDPLVWNLIGPTQAFQPGELSFSGAQYHMAGRVTAMAITPVCTPASCRLWVAAAGGGIWRTDNPLSPDPKYFFVSQGFSSNAIGTLDQDLIADPSGNTLYAGTGEPNASTDSEAGVGIYKTTDGG